MANRVDPQQDQPSHACLELGMDLAFAGGEGWIEFGEVGRCPQQPGVLPGDLGDLLDDLFDHLSERDALPALRTQRGCLEVYRTLGVVLMQYLQQSFSRLESAIKRTDGKAGAHTYVIDRYFVERELHQQLFGSREESLEGLEGTVLFITVMALRHGVRLCRGFLSRNRRFSRLLTRDRHQPSVTM